MNRRSLLVALLGTVSGARVLAAQSSLAPPTNVHVVTGTSAPTPPPPAPTPPPPPPPLPGASHAYFDSLSARPDVLAAYSLRDQAQIDTYRGAKSQPSAVIYDPQNDRDPRKQDAAKVLLPANSLQTQVWLPTKHQPRQNLLVTWDMWYGKEFKYQSSLLGGHKAWNLCSPNEAIWTELQALYDLASSTSDVAFTAIRQYSGWGPNTSPMGGVNMNGRNYGNTTIGPMKAEFGVRPETWTRHWLYFQQDPPWYRMYLWMADPNRGPVQVYDGLQVLPRLPGVGTSMDGTWDILRVEYNTSQAVVSGTRPLVGYTRNVVMLKNLALSTVSGLLQRPA
jgi:hypothetical protein